jgi:hypothetical protein
MNMNRILTSIAALALLAPATVAAQQSGDFTATASVGGTYYCIVSRCDTGVTMGAHVAYGLLQTVALEARGSRHLCFDCDRYFLVEGGAQLRLPGGRVQPFLAAGASLHSDPEFFGDATGPYAGVGVWLHPMAGLTLRAELRGHQLDRGSRLGELSVAAGHRFGGGERH